MLHLIEEQSYLLPVKIKEQKFEILSAKNKYSINKFKYHIEEFDRSLYYEIFDQTQIDITINSSLGNYSITYLFIDILKKNHDSSLDEIEKAELWNLETLEKELVRNSHMKYFLEFYTERAGCIMMANETKITNNLNLSTKFKIIFQKYFRHAIMSLCFIIFLMFSASLIYLLVGEFFSWELQPVYDFWANLSFSLYMLCFPVCLLIIFVFVINGILETSFGYFGGLIPKNNTDILSMNYFVSNISRIVAPMCLNIFQMMKVKHPQFNQIMIRENILSTIILYINQYFPPLLIFLFLFKLLDRKSVV